MLRPTVALGALALVLASVHPTSAEETVEVLVVVNAQNPITTLSKKELTAIFLREKRAWDDGRAIHPVDLPVRSPVRQAFSEQKLGRPVRAVESFWQSAEFSGRGMRPPVKAYESHVLSYVTQDLGGIGYVSSRVRTGEVKVVTITD